MSLLTYPNDMLNMESSPVDTPKEAMDIEQILRQTFATELSWGTPVGLAAPQVMIMKQAFLAMGLYFINPKVLFMESKTKRYNEGCYSLVRQKMYPVRRAIGLDLQYDVLAINERTGLPELKSVISTFDGKMAQVIQHELDHLSGITLIERGKI